MQGSIHSHGPTQHAPAPPALQDVRREYCPPQLSIKLFLYLWKKKKKITESQSQSISWVGKGPTKIIKSNSWPCIGICVLMTVIHDRLCSRGATERASKVCSSLMQKLKICAQNQNSFTNMSSHLSSWMAGDWARVKVCKFFFKSC